MILKMFLKIWERKNHLQNYKKQWEIKSAWNSKWKIAQQQTNDVSSQLLAAILSDLEGMSKKDNAATKLQNAMRNKQAKKCIRKIKKYESYPY